MIQEQSHSKRCEAMIDKGITEPDSREGIDCCLECPYEYCVVFENREQHNLRTSRGRKIIAAKLRGLGVSVKDIALILNISEFTIKSYTRKHHR